MSDLVILSANPSAMTVKLAKAPAGKERVFTQADAAVLRSFDRGASIKSIALQLGACEAAVTKWLKRMGIYRAQHRPHARTGACKDAKCPRCKILLKEAPAGGDGLCGYCVEEIEVLQ